MKVLPEMYLCTRKLSLNFGSHPDVDPDMHFFVEEIFTIVGWGNSTNFADDSSCRQILTILPSCDRIIVRLLHPTS